MKKNSAIEDFMKYISNRIEISETIFENQPQLREAEKLIFQTSSEIKNLLPPSKQHLIDTLCNAEREREYWSHQAVYIQAMLDAQEITVFFQRGKSDDENI